MKKSLLRLHLLACLMTTLCFGLASTASAQLISSYSTQTVQGSYVQLAIDSLIAQNDFDDERYQNIAIGFSFPFRDAAYNRIHISANGFIKLGTTPIASNGYVQQTGVGNILANTLNDNNIIAGMAGDLVARPTLGRISIGRRGTAPNRAFTVQFRNLKRFGQGPGGSFNTNDSINFQITLFESGTIEIGYGVVRAGANGARGFQVGMRGLLNDVIAMTGPNFASANASTTPLATLLFDTPNTPPNGLIYRFTPLPPSDLDGQILSVSPQANPRTGCQLTTAETVNLVVRNRGNQPISSATVGIIVNGSPSTPKQVTFSPALIRNQQAVVQLTGVNGADLSQFRAYSIKGYLQLADDTIPGNDTARIVFSVQAPTSVNSLSPVTSLAQAWASGWQEAIQSINSPGDSVRGVWENGNNPYPTTIALWMSPNQNIGRNAWLWRPGIQTDRAMAVRFKLALSALNNNGPATTLVDDTLKVMVTDDCGATWRTLARFSREDQSNNVVGTDLRTFIIPFAPAAGTYSIGFMVRDNNTGTSGFSYRWHLDDIEFIDTASVANDLAVTSVALSTPTQSGCLPAGALTARVTVRNAGLRTLTQVNVGMKVDNIIIPMASYPLSPALAPGQSATVLVPGVPISAFGYHDLVAYQNTVQDSQHLNDTATTQIYLRPPVTVPFITAATSLQEAINQGWLQSRYNFRAPSDTLVDYWAQDNVNLAGAYYFAMNQSLQQTGTEWFFQPAVTTNGPIGLRFKLAVTNGQGNGPVGPAIDDDTLKVMSTSDCGLTWRTLARFSQSDVISGRIGNAFKEFVVAFAPSAGTYGIGFQMKDNGSDGTNYRWYLDDLEFVTGTNLALDTILSPGLLGGFCPQRPIALTVVVENRGVIPQDSIVLGVRYDNGAVQRRVFQRRLAAGSSDTISFLPDQPAGRLGIVQVQVFTINPDDQQNTNDSLRVTTIVAPAQNLTAATLNSLNEMLIGGFYQATTRDELPTPSVFEASSDFGATLPTATYTEEPGTSPGTTGWLISPTYVATTGIGFSFRAALTSAPSGIFPETEIGEDSMMVMYRLRCGDWQTIFNFSQVEVGAGVIDNTLKLFETVVQAPTLGDTMQFAFRFTRGRQPTSRPYRWHINRISLVNGEVANRPTLLPGLRLYPNPAHRQVTVDFGTDLKQTALSVKDASGRTLFSMDAKGTQARLDVSRLAPGFYTLIVQTGTGIAARILTVE